MKTCWKTTVGAALIGVSMAGCGSGDSGGGKTDAIKCAGAGPSRGSCHPGLRKRWAFTSQTWLVIVGNVQTADSTREQSLDQFYDLLHELAKVARKWAVASRPTTSMSRSKK